MKAWKIEIDWGKFGRSIYDNIANFISILRIACSPIITIMMACAFCQFVYYGKIVWPESYSDLTFKLYIACQISDALDGFLARILKITSRWGAFLDRVGDKILIIPIFFFMLLFYLILAFQLKSLSAFPIAGLLCFSIYLERQLISYGLRGFKTKAPIDSNKRGKVKMVLQCIISAYWMMGFLSPATVLNLLWIKVSVNPLLTYNLIFTLILISAIVAFTVGSIAGYKSIPEYKKMLGENNG